MVYEIITTKLGSISSPIYPKQPGFLFIAQLMRSCLIFPCVKGFLWEWGYPLLGVFGGVALPIGFNDLRLMVQKSGDHHLLDGAKTL